MFYKHLLVIIIIIIIIIVVVVVVVVVITIIYYYYYLLLFIITIIYTIFKHKDVHKVTWMHPRSKHWHMLDYIITRHQDLSEILDTRAMRGADCWTDHVLLRCQARFAVHKPVRKKPSCIKRKFDVSRLKCTGIQSELQEKLCELLPALPVDTDTAEHAWTVFRDAVFSAPETALGFCKRKHQDWFDQNDQDILTLIEAKRSAHAAWLSDKNSASKHALFKQLHRQVQSRTRELKNAWWADKATEVQNHADNKQSKEFYAGLKSIFGPVQCTTAPIRNRDGMLCCRQNSRPPGVDTFIIVQPETHA